MNGIYGALNTAGLTNHDSEDFGSIIMGKRSAYDAFCDSEHCSTGYKPKRKIVVGEPVDCPDCDSILIWKRKKKRIGSEIHSLALQYKSKQRGKNVH